MLPVQVLKQFKQFDLGGEAGYIVSTKNSDIAFWGAIVGKSFKDEKYSLLAELHGESEV